MKFYEIDHALDEAIKKGDNPVRLRLAIDRGGHGVHAFEDVFERDIVDASFYGLKEAAGGTTARGEVLLDNPGGLYSVSDTDRGAGREVRVSFSIGEGLPWFERFVLYVDDKGFQDIRGPGRGCSIRIVLRDRSAILRKTDEARDWTNPAVFTYSVICDKTQPERSLVHLIAQRAGLGVSDIDCATIPLTLPYARLTKNIWAELSELALTYRCHLECAPEKPLVFAHSPYQAEPFIQDDDSYEFAGEDVFYLRETARADRYRNTVRLKINMPVALEKQEIWRYEDPPVIYGENLQTVFPFRPSYFREIEHEGYEARYVVKDVTGKNRYVVYADHLDIKEEAESRLAFSGGPFSYAAYDVTSHPDRAIVQLSCGDNGEGDLYHAAIYGRPIVLDINRSCFKRDDEAVAKYGTTALNVSGSYFSEDDFNGRPMYEDWVGRELTEMLTPKREITIKTHRGVFHGRVGATVRVKTKGETVRGIITALSLRYRREAAFEATYKLMET
ncbi:MAG: hypothetical protein LBQ67_03080 [Treponema sp.]|nr:hypothetical protein [Treponema sp.]